MPNPPEKSTGFVARFRHLLGLYGESQTLYGLFVVASSLIVTYSKVLSVQGAWQNSVPWFLWLASWFFGSALVVGITVRLASATIPKIKARIYPPLISMTLEGGKNDAYATVTCIRGATNVRVDGKIAKTFDVPVNPFPHVFTCYLSKDYGGGLIVSLSETQWARLKLAWLYEGNLYVYKTSSEPENVGQGAIVELRLYADGSAPRFQQYKITAKKTTDSFNHQTKEWIEVELLPQAAELKP